MKWLRQLFFLQRRYDDLSLSIQEHLEERADELMDDGMSREEAVQAARREFGNVALIEERSREEWMWPKVEAIRADLKYAVRQLIKHPGFAMTAAKARSRERNRRPVRSERPISINRSRQRRAARRAHRAW